MSIAKSGADTVAALPFILVLSACSGREDAATAMTAPALPTGRLQLVGQGITDARYLALDEVRKSGTTAQVLVLIVGKTPTALQGGSALMARRQTIDCSTRNISGEQAGFYDAAGKLLRNELQSSTVGRPASASDAEVDAVCAAASPPPVTLAGWRAAQRDVQQPPADLKARAGEDPETWAWLCSGAARGRAPNSAADECDRAVALNPQLASVRIDRGYLRLMRGDRAGADADFKQALVMEQANPHAIFGRSLVAAMNGNKAASRVDRGRAFDLDPKIPDKVEATYGIQIWPEFRTR